MSWMPSVWWKACRTGDPVSPWLWERGRLPRVPSSKGMCFRLRRMQRTMSASAAR